MADGHIYEEVWGAASAAKVFAAIFSLPGLALLVLGISGGAPLVPMLVTTALSSIVPLLVLSFRKGRRVDLQARKVQSWWGFFIPWSKSQSELDDFSQVELRRETRKRGRNQSYTVFVIRLTGSQELLWREHRARLAGRRSAEQVAKATQFMLKDSSSGAMVERPPHLLDECVKSRFERTGERVELPARPDLSGEGIQLQEGQELVVEIPPVQIPGLVLAIGGGFLSLPVFFILGTLAWTVESADLPIVLAFFAVPTIIVGAYFWRTYLRKTRERTTIKVTSKHLLIERSSSKKTEFLHEQLEEFELVDTLKAAEHQGAKNVPFSLVQIFGGGVSICATSDHHSETISGGASPEALRFLHARILQALVEGR